MEQDELLFFDGHPHALATYAALRGMILARCPAAVVRPKKTQIGFGAPLLCVIAWLPRRKADGDHLMLSICLPYRIESARVRQAVEPYPGRHMHHLLLPGPESLDSELLAWIDQAIAFAQR